MRTAMPFASLTSGRGNRVIIDDPHSTEQVESDADRERAERIFRESVTSRLNDPQRDAIVVIMHRLHPNDLCGVIDQLGLPYVKLVLPMEYVRSVTVKTPWFEDPRKEEGEILVSPERLPREKLEQTKLELGSYGYDTQYQQQPRGRDGSQFFVTSQLLADGHPVEAPAMCGAVFAVIDSATKTGNDHDGTAVVYAALINHPEPRLVIVDWDIVQIEGSLLEAWLPQVFARLEELARETRARSGSAGVWIEDKASGMILLQQAARRGWAANPIGSKLASVGKSERALSVSGYVNKGWVKIARCAYEKVTIYKGRSRNHLLSQVTSFRIGVQDRDDDLLDAWVYSIALGLGNADGF
jgi:phage terminase large subunit-like protein